MKYETVMKLNNERVYYDFEQWPFHAKQCTLQKYISDYYTCELGDT